MNVKMNLASTLCFLEYFIVAKCIIHIYASFLDIGYSLQNTLKNCGSKIFNKIRVKDESTCYKRITQSLFLRIMEVQPHQRDYCLSNDCSSWI